MVEIWYGLSDANNGQPICYLKDLDYLANFKEKYLRFATLEKLGKKEKPAQLEFVVEKEGKHLDSLNLKTMQ